jgi:hypothetical protein
VLIRRAGITFALRRLVATSWAIVAEHGALLGSRASYRPTC